MNSHITGHSLNSGCLDGKFGRPDELCVFSAQKGKLTFSSVIEILTMLAQMKIVIKCLIDYITSVNKKFVLVCVFEKFQLINLDKLKYHSVE